MEITDEQLLLGMPWFINANTEINWRDKSISFVVEEAEFFSDIGQRLKFINLVLSRNVSKDQCKSTSNNIPKLTL